MNFPDIRLQRKWLIWVLITAAFVRIATLGAYPLTDNTEARYAEVAREMVTTGNWITPQLHGDKFWAKPPLSFWVTAAAMSLFGINEFSARLASFLLSFIVVCLTGFTAAKQKGRDDALKASVILVSTVLFFVSSGAVMTDAALMLGTTLSMTAFWQAVTDSKGGNRFWGYLFFSGLVIGLLAKGPVGVVLTFLPIGLWTMAKNQWKRIWIKIPWISGLFFMTALSLPWYIAAEMRTPGFFKYYFIGEHWMRFVKPGWPGDLYGSAHSQPHGMIWLFWLIAAFPWSLMFLYSCLKTADARRCFFGRFRQADEWSVYLAAWAVSPMIFFSLAGNILWTYVLPGLPAFSLLAAQCLFPASVPPDDALSTHYSSCRPASFIGSGLFTPLVFGLLIILFSSFGPVKNIQKCQKNLITCYQTLRSGRAGRLIYIYDRPCSAEFYSSGKALQVEAPDKVVPFLADAVPDFFVIKEEFMPRLSDVYKDKLITIDTYNEYALLRENTASPSLAATDKQD